jgi:hypothetical protein
MRRSSGVLASGVTNSHPSDLQPKATLTRRRFVKIAGTTFAAISVLPVLDACSSTPVVTMQFIQSVQNRSNSIRLVAGKRTLIRVFVPTSREVANVTGSLTISGTRAGTITLTTPLNPGGVITAVPDPDINDLTQTLNFELPMSTLANSITVTASVHIRGDSAVLATGGGRVSFVRRPQQKLLPILLRGGPTNLSRPSLSDYILALQGARTRWPFAEDGFVLDPPFVMDIPGIVDLRGGLGWDLLVAQLATMIFLFPPTDVGGIRTALVAPVPGAPYSGIAAPHVILSVPSMIVQMASGPTDVVRAQNTFAHELGHTFGLGHANCGSPQSVDSRLPGNTDMMGVDVPNRSVMPSGSPEIMSYCANPRWPSSASYNLVLSQDPI